jgi:spore germination protein GerM
MTDEDALRRILVTEAESVEVAPDALAVIRRRVARRRQGWRRFLPSGVVLISFGGGTAVVAAATVAVVLAASPQAGPPPQPPGGSGATPTGVTPAPAANLPVYYLGTTSLGVRLFREYHVLPVAGSDPAAHIRAALTAMLTTSGPSDTDYTTPWQDATVTSVRVDADTATVDLHGVPATPPAGAGTARIAVQQLVWTVTAASDTTAVRVLVDGRSLPTLWGVAGLDAPLTRAPRADVQAPIWLIDPQQAAPVGHTVKVYLAGTVPGGTAGLRVLRGSTVVSDQPVQLNASAPQQGEAYLTLTLDPGTYTVVAYVPGEAGGVDRDSDGHEITVR